MAGLIECIIMNELSNFTRNQMVDFMTECLETKKRKADLEGPLTRKMAETRRVAEQACKMKEQFKVLKQKLDAKMSQLALLQVEEGQLCQEWSNAED